MGLPRVTPLCLAVVLLAGCAASYNERMTFLDQMSAKGIEYRGQLQKQGTDPSEQACGIGFDLLKPDIPSDQDGGDATPAWRAQVREAYMKSCLTGAARPKPDPSGVKAVTPVPFGSKSPVVVTPTPAHPSS